MDVELIEIRNFLAEHAPFSALPPALLDALPREVSIRYLRRGTPFPPPDADGDYLYLLRTGAVELRDGQEALLERYGEGEVYASSCLGTAATRAGSVSEDSLLYLLPCQRVAALRRDYPGFDEYFEQSLAKRLRRALHLLQEPAPAGSGLVNVNVGELMSGPVVSVTPETPIGEAAGVMSTRHISALLVAEAGQPLGIVTDRDLRNRVLAAARSSDDPIRTVMSAELHTIGADLPAFEALLAMTRLGIHHLPVTTAEGTVGMLSLGDLMRAQSANAAYLSGDIRRSRTVEELREACRALPELQIQQVTAGISADHLGQSISALTDTLTVRLLALAEEQLGPAPIAYAWMAVGSHARREQTVHSDQDNALILADDYVEERHGRYFERLSGMVSDGLAACGFAYCPGQVMATNPQWRQPHRRWRAYFRRWIDEPEKRALMLACNFFDMRLVHGDRQLAESLRGEVLVQARDNEIFLAYLAANALERRPPLGFFRNFVLSHDGEHGETLDLKLRGVVPIIDLARLHALAAGNAAVNTRARLAAMDDGLITPQGAADLRDALELLGRIKARHQVNQLTRGEAPDNFVRPEELSRLERQHLKDAFLAVSTIQRAIGHRYQSSRFF